MIKLLTIATHLADSLHYLRGVRFDVTDVADNADYQKALELGQKAHEQLLAMIDEMATKENYELLSKLHTNTAFEPPQE